MLKGCLTTLFLSFVSLSFAKKYTNFVVVLMDDMGYGDIKANGAIGYQTPHIDQMIHQGRLFTHYYAPQAVSGASRAGLLTGCYPNRIGLWGAPYPGSKKGISDQEMTIAEVLKQCGYRCGIFGKWHLGDQPPFLPLRHGFDEFFGIPYSNDMWPNHPTEKFPDLPLYDGDRIVEYNPDQTQFTTHFTERAVRFIDRNKKNPFFLYVAHPMPHVPLFVSDKFKGKSDAGLYGDVMMELDWSIGQILDKLKSEHLEENTLVIITSDNGPWLNYGNHAGSAGGLREGKGVSFEGGQRVPCVMRWKKAIPEGTICNQMITGIDFLSTFAAIAGAPLPTHTIDGVNMLPLLRGETTISPRTYFSFYYRENDLEAVTDGRFKLVFPHKYRTYEGFLPGCDGAPGKVNEWKPLEQKMLFDLRRDPGERYDVIKLYPEVVERLEAYAQGVREDLGDNLTSTSGRGVRSPGKVE